MIYVGRVPESPEPARRRRVTAADVVDVFVNVVVLNLVAQYFPQVIAESFSVSIVTAVVLKVVLEVVVAIKTRLRSRLRAATSHTGRIVSAALLWVFLVGSKFVVLELERLLFGDQVSLGGFLSVTALIIVMLLARSGVRRLLTWSEGSAAGAGAVPAQRA